MTTTTDLTMDRLDELERLIATKTQRKPDVATYGITAWDGLALIARAKRTEQAERERDALRALLVRLVRATQADDEAGEWCMACDHRGTVPHAEGCAVADAYVLLRDAGIDYGVGRDAQPTDAGGA